MKSKVYSVNLGDTCTAVSERIEDLAAQCVSHAQNDKTEVKASVITIKVSFTPDENRRQFRIDVEDNLALSKSKPFSTIVKGGIDEDGQVIIAPIQLDLYRD